MPTPTRNARTEPLRDEGESLPGPRLSDLLGVSCDDEQARTAAERPLAECPLDEVRLRDGKLITLKELKAADEFAVEKILQGEGVSLDGAGQGSYLRAIAFASIATIDGHEEAAMRHKAQFDRFLNMFSARDANMLVQAVVRFNTGDTGDDVRT